MTTGLTTTCACACAWSSPEDPGPVSGGAMGGDGGLADE